MSQQKLRIKDTVLSKYNIPHQIHEKGFRNKAEKLKKALDVGEDINMKANQK